MLGGLAYTAVCGAVAQLPWDQVLIDRVPARPWLATTFPRAGNVTVALPNAAVTQNIGVGSTGQATYDPMVFIDQCESVVLCNRHIYACNTAPFHCFLGTQNSAWHCPDGTSASCWSVQNGALETGINVNDYYMIEFRNNSAVAYTTPSPIAATQHVVLAFGMVAIAIALQQNVGNQALRLNWAAATTSVLVTTTTVSRMGNWPHVAATTAAAFLVGKMFLNKSTPSQNRNLRVIAIIASLSSVPVEKLGITPLLYAAFVISLCIAAEAQEYHWLQAALLTFWASAAIDNTVAAAYLYESSSFSEVTLSVAIALSSAAAGVLGQ